MKKKKENTQETKKFSEVWLVEEVSLADKYKKGKSDRFTFLVGIYRKEEIANKKALQIAKKKKYRSIPNMRGFYYKDRQFITVRKERVRER